MAKTLTVPRRVVIISDLHCGHQTGLTPPKWNPDYNNGIKRKLSKARAERWRWYAAQARALQPVDVLIVNGDAIDGKGQKSGGTEQIEPDRAQQAEMAARCIDEMNAGAVLMTYGTPYHTGQGEDWEDEVTKQVKNFVKIGSHDWVDVAGLIFDIKHKVGSSSVPYGRLTPIAKERNWNSLWSERDEYPKSDVIIRSHVHYYAFCGGLNWLAITTPALQGYGSKFGARQCSGTVDFGLIWFDVWGKDYYEWHAELLRAPKQKPHMVKV